MQILETSYFDQNEKKSNIIKNKTASHFYLLDFLYWIFKTSTRSSQFYFVTDLEARIDTVRKVQTISDHALRLHKKYSIVRSGSILEQWTGNFVGIYK